MQEREEKGGGLGAVGRDPCVKELPQFGQVFLLPPAHAGVHTRQGIQVCVAVGKSPPPGRAYSSLFLPTEEKEGSRQCAW